MSKGLQNESTSNNRTNVSRSRFEQNVVRYDTPPWYLKPDRHEAETGDAFKFFNVPYGGGVCKVSWPEGPKGKLEFEWS
tara:strand:+ start:3067 stop:3303 length:237 start_codon:yes stop_codon:yes gene_type:complete